MSNTIAKRQRKVIIYTRVSTDEQAEKGTSLLDQVERLRKYCESNGYEIVAHFQDDHSAKDFNRPEFQKMLALIKSKTLKADLFLTVRFDRFSRNLIHSLNMINELKKYGIEFNNVEQPIDNSAPESYLSQVLYMAIPQIENERRGLNTKGGMRRAKIAGRWMGKAPRGYSNSQRNGEKSIEPNADAEWIKWAFKELATGLYTIEDVRRQLQKKGFKITKSPFNKLVKNPAYIGKIKVAASKDEPEIMIDGNHEPIISEELFLSVQDILEGRKHTARPKQRKDENFPLRGFLECPQCGNPLTASFSKGRSAKYGYYHCQQGCGERQKYEEVNDAFTSYLSNFSVEEEVLELYYLILQDVFDKEKKDKNKEAAHITGLMDSYNKKLDVLLDNFMEKRINQQDYERGKKLYGDELYRLQSQKQQLEFEQKDFMVMVQYSFGMLKDLGGYYEKSEIEVKHKILGSIFPEKLIYENGNYRTAEINSVIPLICNNINSFGQIKEKRTAINNNPSLKVAYRGIEPLLQERKS